jgi:putative ABC transport system permease protein
MPPGYIYPTWADLWAPISTILSTDAALAERGVHVDSRVVGRLRVGVDSAAGQRALSAVAAHLAEAYPAENGGWSGAALIPVAFEVLGDTGTQLRLLTAAAVLVLLIACINVAGLALAHVGSRTRELAIRTALGGGRGALLRLLAAECVLMCSVAGALGLALAALTVRWVRLAGRDFLPRADEVAVDVGVLLAATALAVLILVALGLLPALRAPGSLAASLSEGMGAGRGPGQRRLRAALVVGEIALSLVLLAGAGLLLRSLERLQQVPVGLDVERLLAVPIEPPSPQYDGPERALQLYRDIAAAVAMVPGVQSVALTNHVPLSGASTNTAIEVDGTPPGEDDSDQALFREVDSTYFRTAGIPIIRGRNFTPDEIARPGDAVLVNRALADRYWPRSDPIGRRITVYKSAQGRPDFGEPLRVTVVGVVGNVRHFSLESDFEPEVYLPYTVTVWPRMALLVRAGGDPDHLAHTVARAVRSVDADLPLEGARLVHRVYTLSESRKESLAYRRFTTMLLGAFAVSALLLAALGIYGVVAYFVMQRSREMGIRMALGAGPAAVVKILLMEGMRLAMLGVALGAAAAAVTTRWLQSQLYETSATDPVTFVGTAAVLTMVAALATLIPAYRATAIDPARTLRAE